MYYAYYIGTGDRRRGPVGSGFGGRDPESAVPGRAAEGGRRATAGSWSGRRGLEVRNRDRGTASGESGLRGRQGRSREERRQEQREEPPV